jgi:hypothetical protein
MLRLAAERQAARRRDEDLQQRHNPFRLRRDRKMHYAGSVEQRIRIVICRSANGASLRGAAAARLPPRESFRQLESPNGF